MAVAAIARRMVIQLWHLLRGRGVTREDQQKSLMTKLRHITTTIGKEQRNQVGLPSSVAECVAELMKRIEQTKLPVNA